jgi:PAS domain S-box-containing protein
MFRAVVCRLGNSGPMVLRDTSGLQPTSNAGTSRQTRDEVENLVAGIPGISMGAIFALRKAPDGAFAFPYADPVVERVYNRSRNDLAQDASPVIHSIHADDRKRVFASLEKSERALAEWRCEFRVDTPDKGPIRLEAHATPRREADGSVVWFGYANGASRDRQAETESQRSRELLEAFVDSAPIGIAMFDRDLRYIRSSPRWQKVMATTGADLRGRHHYEDVQDMPAKWVDAHQRGQAGETVKGEDEWLRPDGKRALHRWEVHPWGDAETDSGGIIIMFEDVTEARAMEAELRHAHKMEALGQLAGGVAHDFNNLLQIIQGYTQLLQDQVEGNEAATKFAGEVLQAARRASSLTRQLLAFSRRQVFTPTVVDLNDVVHSTSKMLRRLLGEDIDFDLKLEDTLWRVEADSDQLSQVLINLCVNARDAMPYGGTLTVATRNQPAEESVHVASAKLRPGDYVVLTVRDTGTGMSASVLEHIFEPFFTTKEAGKGTGLGLSTVYGIVRQSNGYIWADSTRGQGTRFTVYLPRTKHESLPATAGGVVVSTARRGNQTVLVVEDDPDVRAAVAEYLPAMGYVVLAADPAQALDVAERHEHGIDLLLIDVVMPGTSGPVLAAKLRALRPGLQTVFMSGYIDDAVTRHGVLESGEPFLQKPFTLSELAGAIREALGRA